jgi:DNA-binding transcriptional MerR regulator
VAEGSRKSDQAFRTIGELADELGVPQHILRYWETRFPPAPPAAARRQSALLPARGRGARPPHHRLLNQDGYTIRGVQQLLAGNSADGEDLIVPSSPASANPQSEFPAQELRAIRKNSRMRWTGLPESPRCGCSLALGLLILLSCSEPQSEVERRREIDALKAELKATQARADAAEREAKQILHSPQSTPSS